MENLNEYGLSKQELANTGCCNPYDKVTGKDANAIQMIESKLIISLYVFY